MRICALLRFAIVELRPIYNFSQRARELAGGRIVRCESIERWHDEVGDGRNCRQSGYVSRGDGQPLRQGDEEQADGAAREVPEGYKNTILIGKGYGTVLVNILC